MLTNMAALATFLATEGIEGFRLQAYDDATGKTLKEGDEAKGKPTIAMGLTRYSDGDPVEPGDEIGLQEAYDETFRYFDKELVPAFDRLITIDLPEHRQHAFASWLYNFGEEKARRYTLPKLINTNAGDEAIISKWMEYVYAQGEPKLGLHRRRLAEVLMWMNLDWRAALNASFEDDAFSVIRRLSGEADMDLFEELEIPRRGADPVTDKYPSAGPVLQVKTPAGWADMSDAEKQAFLTRASEGDPTPATEWTMDDRQYAGAAAAGYTGSFEEFLAHRQTVSKKNVISTPKVDLSKPPKAMEDSKTHRGLSKKESGREAVTIGTIVTGAATVTATVDGLTKGAEKTQATAERAATFIGGLTLTDVIIVALVIGLPLIAVGLWRWYRGQEIAIEGRSEGTQAKV